MKKIFLIILVIFSVTSFAKTREEKNKELADAETAKDICLMKEKFLRGKKLQDCTKKEIEKLQRPRLK